MSRRRPRVYFSFRSPFSWMALKVLEQRVPDYATRYELIPFFEPDAESAAALAERGGEFHYVAMSKAKHLYILNDTKRLAAGLGLDLVWPIDVDPWWELPHLAWIRARELGCEREFYTAVTDARWLHGRDICEPEVLEETLRQAGLPILPLLTAPHDPAIRAAGVEALMRVYEDDVFGVPYFRSGPHKFWGLDRVEQFVAAVSPEVLADGSVEPDAVVTDDVVPDAVVPAAVLAAVGAYDHDTAGGCG